MSTINIKLPDSFKNTRKLANKSDPVLDRSTIFRLLEKNHLVVCFDDPKDEDSEPVYLLGFLNAVNFTATGVKFQVAVIGSEGHVFTATFDNIKYVPDYECPQVFFKTDTQQAIGDFIGLTETEDAIVRLLPLGTYNTVRCSLDSMCFCSDIPLGVSGKEA